MKKIKLLTPFLGLSVIASTAIPLAGCSCSQSTDKIIPDNMLNISGQTLNGLKSDADLSKYNTLSIPQEINTIASKAFKDKFTGDCPITKVIFSQEMRLVKANAFDGCSSIKTLDFSNWDEETIKYCVFEADAFVNVSYFGKITYPKDITDANKTIITNKLKAAGLNATWFVEETTGHIACNEKEIITENHSDVFTFALTEELAAGQEIVCLSTTTSASEGVTLTVDQNVAVTAKSAVLSTTINNASKTDDYVGFDAIFVCYKDAAHTNIAWIESVKGLKYTFKIILPELTRLEAEISSEKTPTLERASLSANNVTVKAVYTKHEVETEETIECGGENGYTVTKTFNGVEKDITDEFKTTKGFEFYDVGSYKLTFKFGGKTLDKEFTINARPEPTIAKNRFWSFENINGIVYYELYCDVHGSTSRIGIQMINSETGKEETEKKQYIARNKFNAEVRIGSELDNNTFPPQLLLNCTSFNSKIIWNNNIITTIDNGFLTGCKSFNQPIEIPTSINTIGANFMDGCESFNQQISIPNNVTSIGASFMKDCLSFNRNLTLPNNLSDGIDGLLTMSNGTSPAFASTVNVGDYTVAQLGANNLQKWFGYNNNTIYISGTNKDAIVTEILKGTGHPNVKAAA